MLRSPINSWKISPKKPRNRGIRECVPLSEDLIISDKKTQKYLYTHEQKTQKFCYTCVPLPTKNPEISVYVGTWMTKYFIRLFVPLAQSLLLSLRLNLIRIAPIFVKFGTILADVRAIYFA